MKIQWKIGIFLISALLWDVVVLSRYSPSRVRIKISPEMYDVRMNRIEPAGNMAVRGSIRIHSRRDRKIRRGDKFVVDASYRKEFTRPERDEIGVDAYRLPREENYSGYSGSNYSKSGLDSNYSGSNYSASKLSTQSSSIQSQSQSRKLLSTQSAKIRPTNYPDHSDHSGYSKYPDYSGYPKYPVHPDSVHPDSDHSGYPDSQLPHLGHSMHTRSRRVYPSGYSGSQLDSPVSYRVSQLDNSMHTTSQGISPSNYRDHPGKDIWEYKKKSGPSGFSLPQEMPSLENDLPKEDGYSEYPVPNRKNKK